MSKNAMVDVPPTFPDRSEILRLLKEVDPSSALHRRCRELLKDFLEVESPLPKPSPRRQPRFLTIGMATHDDYDGCYFSIQAIRLYHPEILEDVEFLVIDNNPAGPCAQALKALERWAPDNYRYIPCSTSQGTAVRDLIFREAAGEFVLCMDSHVLFPAGALAGLILYFRRNPASNDLLQGPILNDEMEVMATHFKPIWSAGMFGVWDIDARGTNSDAPPFEIPMQGLGVFACRRDAWPGFNPRLAGFGGEEGYIHEKIRREGGRNLCLPFLRWLHRFERPLGVPYSPSWQDRIRNYMLIHEELGMDPAVMIAHFEQHIGMEPARSMVQKVHSELTGPFHFFDGIYCINLDRQPQRWEEMQRRFQKLGIKRRIRRFAAADTPLNHHIGCALSHRRIIAEARKQQLKTILVFEDDARFTPDALEVLSGSLEELRSREWKLLYLGGYFSTAQKAPGCQYLSIPDRITCTHAIAYHHTIYDLILNAVPDSAVDVAVWAGVHAAIDQFYTFNFQESTFVTNPVIATQGSLLPSETRVFED